MTRIHTITSVGIEHLLGAATGKGLVKLRVAGPEHILLDDMSPAMARDIAAHLFEAAARAEYEQDLWSAGKAAGLDDQALGAILHLIRHGETGRHESPEADHG